MIRLAVLLAVLAPSVIPQVEDVLLTEEFDATPREWAVTGAGVRVQDGILTLTDVANVTLPREWTGTELTLRVWGGMQEFRVSYGEGRDRFQFQADNDKLSLSRVGEVLAEARKMASVEMKWSILELHVQDGFHVVTIDGKPILTAEATGTLSSIRVETGPSRFRPEGGPKRHQTRIDSVSLWKGRSQVSPQQPRGTSMREIGSVEFVELRTNLREVVRGESVELRVFSENFTLKDRVRILPSSAVPRPPTVRTTFVNAATLQVAFELPADHPDDFISLAFDGLSGRGRAHEMRLAVVDPPARPPEQTTTKPAPPEPSPWIPVLAGAVLLAVGFPGGYAVGRLQEVRRWIARFARGWEDMAETRLPKRPKLGRWACRLELQVKLEEWGLAKLDVVLESAGDRSDESFEISGLELECLDAMDSLQAVLLESEDKARERISVLVHAILGRVAMARSEHGALDRISMRAHFKSGVARRFVLVRWENVDGVPRWVEKKSWIRDLVTNEELAPIRVARSSGFLKEARREVEDELLELVRRTRLVGLAKGARKLVT